MARKFTYDGILPPKLMPMVAIDTRKGYRNTPDIPSVAGLHLLTPRQSEILNLTLRDMTPKDIGASLNITPEAVQSILRDIRNKLVD